MKCVCVIALFSLALVAEARSLKENRRISPALSPASPSKFEKDYAGDKRPAADILHFAHPYPVVQDAEDFDKDFVKDENTDNGEWKAQSEYDKLRHKLAKLKKEAAEALKKKNDEKKELEEAMSKYEAERAKDKAVIAKKSNEVIVKPTKPEEPVKPVKPEKPAKLPKKEEPKPKQKAPQVPVVEKKDGGSGWSFPWPSWSWPTTTKAPTTPKPKATTQAPPTPTPKPTMAPFDASGAKSDIEKAIDNLKECQSELEQAKAALKKLMSELEKAKVDQVEAREKLSQAKIKQTEAEKHEVHMNKKYTKEAKEHADAEAAYLKKKAAYELLVAQLKAASTKVTEMRAAEDLGGGVYPTATRSAASSISTFKLLVCIFAGVAAQQMA